MAVSLNYCHLIFLINLFVVVLPSWGFCGVVKNKYDDEINEVVLLKEGWRECSGSEKPPGDDIIMFHF